LTYLFQFKLAAIQIYLNPADKTIGSQPLRGWYYGGVLITRGVTRAIGSPALQAGPSLK
jgi:hypothetical protein